MPLLSGSSTLQDNEMEILRPWGLLGGLPLELFDIIMDDVLSEGVEAGHWDHTADPHISEVGMFSQPYAFLNGLLGANKATRAATLALCLQRFTWRFENIVLFTAFLQRCEKILPGAPSLIKEVTLHSNIYGEALEMTRIVNNIHFANSLPQLEKLWVIFEEWRVTRGYSVAAHKEPFTVDFKTALRAMRRLDVKQIVVAGIDRESKWDVEDQIKFQHDPVVPAWFFSEEGPPPVENEEGYENTALEDWARSWDDD